MQDDKGAVRVDRETRLGALTVYGFVDDYALLNPYPTGQGGASVPGFNARTNGRAQLAAVNLQTRDGRDRGEPGACELYAECGGGRASRAAEWARRWHRRDL